MFRAIFQSHTVELGELGLCCLQDCGYYSACEWRYLGRETGFMPEEYTFSYVLNFICVTTLSAVSGQLVCEYSNLSKYFIQLTVTSEYEKTIQ